MSTGEAHERPEEDWERYWDWFAVALFLLLSVDLLTTMGATGTHGLEAEANPLMRWVMEQGLLAIVTIHIVVLLLASAGFEQLLHWAGGLGMRGKRRFRRTLECWLSVLIVIGLCLFANNLAVIVLDNSFV